MAYLPDPAELSPGDTEAVLSLVPTSGGCTSEGDDSDEWTLLRREDGTELVRVHHGAKWDVYGVERLDPGLTPEAGAALAVANLFNELFVGDHTVVDLATRRAFRIHRPAAAAAVRTVSRAATLKQKISRALGVPVEVQLEPAPSRTGAERYVYRVVVAGRGAEKETSLIQAAVEETLERHPDFENVQLDEGEAEITFESGRD